MVAPTSHNGVGESTNPDFHELQNPRLIRTAWWNPRGPRLIRGATKGVDAFANAADLASDIMMIINADRRAERQDSREWRAREAQRQQTGPNQRCLTTAVGGDLYPATDPTGAKVIFASERVGNREIYTMSTDGTNPARLTPSM